MVLRPGKLGANGQSEPGGPVHWTRGELIGQGAFGKVYMGLNSETGQLMAVKQVAFSRLSCMSKAGTFRAHVQRWEPRRMLHNEWNLPRHGLVIGHLIGAAEVGAAELR